MRSIGIATCWFILFTSTALAESPASIRIRGHEDGRLECVLSLTGPAVAWENAPATCRLGEGTESITSKVTSGRWDVKIPDTWRARSGEVLHITAGTGDAALSAVYPVRKMPLPYLPSPSDWGNADEVDEPEGAFHSLGLTMAHAGRDAASIQSFHAFLGEKAIDPLSFPAAKVAPPARLRRILLEPERSGASGWSARGEWCVSAPGHRGPDTRFALRVDRRGMYRCWIRYMGYKDGLAVTSLTLHRAGEEDQAPLVMEEFHTRAVGVDGPAWHDFMVELDEGTYSITLGHVVRYYHAPANASFREHQIDCIYLTDELWRGAPGDELRDELKRNTTPAGAQWTGTPELSADERDAWAWWQVRPSHWETAKADPRLFALSHEFWRREVEALAGADYTAPPLDPVAGGVPDYRDPRRQIVFDPVWNMVANPFRIRTQREILEDDIDPQAKDSFHEWIAPGFFPIVEGQWHREGAGLSADHAATTGLAAGTYTVPHGGKWHLWAQFKNINYFEYFGVYAETLYGRAATWERKERLYPGGRQAWAKVGSFDIPEPTDHEKTLQRTLTGRGTLVEAGRPILVITQGVWRCEDGALEGAGPDAKLLAGCALKPAGDFRIRARLSISGLAGSGAEMFLRESNGVRDNHLWFEGGIKGASFGTGVVNHTAANIRDGEPFDAEFIRTRDEARFLVNGTLVATVPITNALGAAFGILPGKASIRVFDFSATGDLDDGLAL